MRRLAALLALGAVALACPAGAFAADASSDEVRALARAALNDPAALARLRAIDRVDGRPVRIADALPAGDRDALRARLRVLAEGSGGASAAAGPAARDAAREVLADGRYHESGLPRPLRPVFQWLGDRLAPVWNWVGDRFRSISDLAPGASATVWALLAGALLAATALLAARAGARRQSAAAAGSAAARAGRTETAASLLRAAAAAESRGDLDEALRLRFRAGLLDLDERELIELRPALTNRELLVAVHSPTLGELVEDFESVAYGGRPAASDDLREARDGWPRVPEEAAPR
ncbi:MAG: hypothetical protein QOG15_3269 [Solirubrobacteraceae bacterium]|nr:hypothetical protein [Solirubrobacteraceae bacterium]